MKKLLTFLLCFVFLMGAIGLTACGSNSTKQNTVSNIDTAGKPVAGLSVQSVSAPKLGGKTLTAYSTRSGQTGISKRLSATVEPASARNKLVDYRVFWAIGAEHANEDVSDYVIVEQDSDGSTDATVTCVQEFDDDTIVIQVVTRDGRYTAECVVTYAGFISEMSIMSPTLNTVNTQERGDYYEVYTNNTYIFNVDMDNYFHSVRTYDLTIDSQGWSGGNEEYYGGYINPQIGRVVSQTTGDNPHDIKISIPWNNFFAANISGNSLNLSISNKIIETYSNSDFFLLTTANVGNRPYIGNVPEKISANNTVLATRYFYVTVKDNVSNISATIKFWIMASVNSVSLSSQSIQF